MPERGKRQQVERQHQRPLGLRLVVADVLERLLHVGDEKRIEGVEAHARAEHPDMPDLQDHQRCEDEVESDHVATRPGGSCDQRQGDERKRREGAQIVLGDRFQEDTVMQLLAARRLDRREHERREGHQREIENGVGHEQ